MSTKNSSIPQNSHTSSRVVGESNEANNEVQEQTEGLERIEVHLDDHDTQQNEEVENQQIVGTSFYHWNMMKEHPFTILEEV